MSDSKFGASLAAEAGGGVVVVVAAIVVAVVVVVVSTGLAETGLPSSGSEDSNLRRGERFGRTGVAAVKTSLATEHDANDDDELDRAGIV